VDRRHNSAWPTPTTREKGWLNLEGRDYVVQDGQCLVIRFNK